MLLITSLKREAQLRQTKALDQIVERFQIEFTITLLHRPSPFHLRYTLVISIAPFLPLSHAVCYASTTRAPLNSALIRLSHLVPLFSIVLCAQLLRIPRQRQTALTGAINLNNNKGAMII